jgi:hypothetical protein
MCKPKRRSGFLLMLNRGCEIVDVPELKKIFILNIGRSSVVAASIYM